jgi:hypothetical protein
MAQDERKGFELVDDFPFMLRHSKHSEPFSAACYSISDHANLVRDSQRCCRYRN